MEENKNVEPAPEPVEPIVTEPVAELAAPSGAEPTVAEGMPPFGQGAQVVLTGDAQAAARGATHGDIHANTAARDAAIVAGHIEPTTATAAAAAVSGNVFDEIDEAEAEELAKIKADFAERRIARAAKS